MVHDHYFECDRCGGKGEAYTVMVCVPCPFCPKGRFHSQCCGCKKKKKEKINGSIVGDRNHGMSVMASVFRDIGRKVLVSDDGKRKVIVHGSRCRCKECKVGDK